MKEIKVKKDSHCRNDACELTYGTTIGPWHYYRMPILWGMFIGLFYWENTSVHKIVPYTIDCFSKDADVGRKLDHLYKFYTEEKQ